MKLPVGKGKSLGLTPPLDLQCDEGAYGRSPLPYTPCLQTTVDKQNQRRNGQYYSGIEDDIMIIADRIYTYYRI